MTLFSRQLISTSSGSSPVCAAIERMRRRLITIARRPLRSTQAWLYFRIKGPGSTEFPIPSNYTYKFAFVIISLRRDSIGRALINEPGILMADEPTGNLDSETSEKIYGLFRMLNKNGLSLIIVTHNMDLAGLANRVVRLRDGKIALN